MHPLLRWPSGKFRKAKVLAAAFPEHDTYVEPFAGGASLYWNKKPALTEILGDRADWMIRFLDKARRGALRRCRPVRDTAANHERLKACWRDDPCCTLAMNRASWHGAMTSGRESRKDTRRRLAAHILRALPRYERRLRRTHLRIGDFAETIRRWDGPDTLHYLDPPWTARGRSADYSRKKYAGRDEVPVERVAEVAAEMEGKVVISYDDSRRARRAFRDGLHAYKVPTTRTSGCRGTV